MLGKLHCQVKFIMAATRKGQSSDFFVQAMVNSDLD